MLRVDAEQPLPAGWLWLTRRSRPSMLSYWRVEAMPSMVDTALTPLPAVSVRVTDAERVPRACSVETALPSASYR